MLDRPAVAGVIVGARLGVAQHIADNARVFGFALDAGDLAADRGGAREVARSDAADRRLRRRIPLVFRTSHRLHGTTGGPVPTIAQKDLSHRPAGPGPGRPEDRLQRVPVPRADPGLQRNRPSRENAGCIAKRGPMAAVTAPSQITRG